MEKIFVTGAAGFIGEALCKSLLEDGYTVFGLDNLNEYYDVALKRMRLAELKKYKNFKFFLLFDLTMKYRLLTAMMLRVHREDGGWGLC